MAVHIGDSVPDLISFGAPSLPPKLPDTRGVWTVLFFFPKGNHPHCVLESRRFQQAIPEFKQLNVQVIGVSVDSAEDQKTLWNFCTLSFPLVSDARHQISRYYGVLDTATVENEQIAYARRETFLIAPDQRVVHHWTEVDPNTHAAQVLAFLQAKLGTLSN